MKKAKFITTEYDDGSKETVSAPKGPYNAADNSCRHLGVQADGCIYFPDGSSKEIMGGTNHQPPPLNGQYPSLRFKQILYYWSVKLQRLVDEFDRLKERLSQRGSSFKVDIGGNNSTDAIQRLETLSKQIVIAVERKKQAEENFEEVKHPGPKKTEEERIEEIATRQGNERKFYEKVEDIKRPEVEVG